MSLDYVIFFFFLLTNVFVLFYVCALQSCATDCLQEHSNISNGDSTNNIVSLTNKFELGFFTPEGGLDKSIYLGIWYHNNNSNSKIVVWVANREKPVLESKAYLVIKDGNAMVLGKSNTSYWSTDCVISWEHVNQSLATVKPFPISNGTPTSPEVHKKFTGNTNINASNIVSMTLCLKDDGNLVLIDRREQGKILWNRFDDSVTDTLLPGMSIYGSINFNLTSWQSRDKHALGEYTFLPQLTVIGGERLEIRQRGRAHYWESGLTPFDSTPSTLNSLLLGNFADYDTIRLVMNFTGLIQLWGRNVSDGGWLLQWEEPKNNCSLYDMCGNFGSCNSNYHLLCKCLPGFKPNSAEKWNSGDFSVGCHPNSGSYVPGARSDSRGDIFLRLPMMKVRTPDYNESTEGDCRTKCLEDGTCVAYSCGGDTSTRPSSSTQANCLMWSNQLTNLQEDYSEGLTIFVRTTKSDTGSTPRSCNNCGAYIIPYPLSTSANCGDPSYSYFNCNTKTGQVSFSSSAGTFNVTSIDPERTRFFIQTERPNHCDGRFKDSLVRSPKNLLRFSVNSCNTYLNQSFINAVKSFTEVEMKWEVPLEPPCKASSDCRGWPHTTCKAAGGQMRCLCRTKFRWHGSSLKCIKVAFHLKDVLAPVGASAFILLCCTYFILHRRKRRNAERQGFHMFEGYDNEDIDVPFFNWESILAATNNFADANKLGTGGFGSVYKGVLQDGKEIAVKRLSRVSVQGIEEFRTEVVLIAKLQHRNLVKLLGYCVTVEEKILLYEFMPNGSLDSCLFDQSFSVFLDWDKRFDIIFGIARGLLYLHEDSRLRIIHRDLKPSNILLDEDVNPKISDFGIAKIVEGKETEASTKRVVGTIGYMSPEYAYEGLFSVKSDVFSFGVVILEIISGRRNSKIFQAEHGVNLPAHAWRLWSEGRGLELMDETLKESCDSTTVLKCIHVGLLCVQRNPVDRPTMSTVLLILSTESQSLPPPDQPVFLAMRQPSEISSSSWNWKDAITVSTIGR